MKYEKPNSDIDFNYLVNKWGLPKNSRTTGNPYFIKLNYNCW